jgi:hypothetical protein
VCLEIAAFPIYVPRMLRNSLISAALLAALVVTAGVMSGDAHAQAAPQKIGDYRDWSAWIYRDGEQQICFVTSSPKDTLPKGVNRGAIRFNVAHRPMDGVENEISMIVGYPFAPKREALAKIGTTEIGMQTDGERAWSLDPRDDAQMVSAMKAGLEMVITGHSKRGTKTTDTYSLLGFTAAMNAIDKACP